MVVDRVVSSRGYGSFGLEIGLSVWLHPDENDVILLKNNSENDLRLYVDYKVKRGLSQDESSEIVHSQNLRDGIQDYRTSDFELQWVDYIPEVHMVIKCSENKQEQKILKALHIKYLERLVGSSMIIINEWISVSVLDDKILLYNRKLNRAYSFSSSMLKYPVKQGIFYFEECFNKKNFETLQIISELEHLCFIDFKNDKYRIY